MTKTDGVDPWKSQIQKATTGSVYIHVPFCTKKCHYCHFFVLPYQANSIDSYLKGIALEWEMRRELLSQITTLYLGGGTPSLLTPDEVATILSLFPKTEETTIEANPDDVSLEKMTAYRSLGINRVSIGVQSFDNCHLLNIGRQHSANKAVQAVETTFQAGIKNISIDLMYDLPNQTLASWKNTVDLAVQLPISHLSLYNMTLEEGSLYYKNRGSIAKTMPKDEESLAMLQYAVETLGQNGFQRYEISAFCRDGLISKHNTGYWTGRPFLGLGPSAFSYYDGRRFQNICHFAKWYRSLIESISPTDFEESLTYPHNLHELLAIRLRLTEGVSLKDFPSLPEETLQILQDLKNQNFLQGVDTLSLTETGLLFYDQVASDIVGTLTNKL